MATDWTALAPHAELFEHAVKERRKRLELPRFPGGAPLLHCVLAHLAAAQETALASEPASGPEPDGLAGEPPGEPPDLSALASPPLEPASLGSYLEAAAVLGSPRLVRDLLRSPACEELTSRQALVLLELVTGLTAPREDSTAELSETMEGALTEAVRRLAGRLDPHDFRLGPPLAKGSARASLEVLRAFRDKDKEALLETGADTIRSVQSIAGAQSVAGSVSARSSFSVMSMSANDRGAHRIQWTEHEFALYVFAHHMDKETQAALQAGAARSPLPPPDASLPGAEPDEEDVPGAYDEDGEGSDVFMKWNDQEDVTQELCDQVPDACLDKLSGLVAHIEAALTPPIIAAAMVRALLLVRSDDKADALFQAVFPRSPKVRAMVVEREVPVAFLRGVARHRAASVTLRRMLARYETTPPEEVRRLIEELLFEELMEEQHAQKVILEHALARHLVLWMRSGAVPGGARLGALGFQHGQEDGSGAGEAPEDVRRIRQVGERLFAVTFVPQGGFLPAAPADAGQDAVPTPCPWDAGELDLTLLSRVPQTEDALQLTRRVLLRSALKDRGHPADVHSLAQLWPLGRWSFCHDPVLIGEALRFLSACWRALAELPGLGDLAGEPPCDVAAAEADQADARARVRESRQTPRHSGAGSLLGADLLGRHGRREAEELLFKMFTDLEIWRLPPRDLLTPWVPGQVLACHVAAQCRALEDRQITLVEETRENLEEITRLHAIIAQLTSRLEATDTRSSQCMTKQADLDEALRRMRP